MFKIGADFIVPQSSAWTHPDTGVQYPANWLRLSTAQEKTDAGITEEADPAPPVYTPSLPQQLVNTDINTKNAIEEGITHNGKEYSLSDAAQRNLERNNSKDPTVTPIRVSTKDGGYETFSTQAAWDAFYNACVAHIDTELESCQDARAAILANYPQISVAAAITEDPTTVGATPTVSVTATDPNAETLSYGWMVISGPDNSSVTFGDQTASSTTAQFSDAGNYTLRVQITNESMGLVESEFTVVVNAA